VRSPPRRVPDPLTPSELRVLEQLAEGHNNTAIATILVDSLKTVRNYVSFILAKLHVDDRSQAIVAALEAGAHRRPEIQGRRPPPLSTTGSTRAGR
jgi:DNA-binding NarL/FixJ family response regulator